MTWVDEGSVAHMGGSEGFSGEVGDPVTYLVVTRCDKAALLSVKGMQVTEAKPEAIVVAGQVWRCNSVSE